MDRQVRGEEDGGERVFGLKYLPFIVVLVIAAGCADARHEQEDRAVHDYRFGNYPAAMRKLQELAKQTNEDFVLNNCRLGSAALSYDQYDEAEAAFLRAYEVINSVGVNEGGRS